MVIFFAYMLLCIASLVLILNIPAKQIETNIAMWEILDSENFEKFGE